MGTYLQVPTRRIYQKLGLARRAHHKGVVVIEIGWMVWFCWSGDMLGCLVDELVNG